MTNKLNKHPLLKLYFEKEDDWEQFESGRPYSWTKDSRYDEWVKQQRETGIPAYELWGLDHTMILLLAERIMAFSPYLEEYQESTKEAQDESEKDHKKLISLIHTYLTDYNDTTSSKKIWELWSKIEKRYWY